MIPEPLGRVLEATGYLLNGEPAARTVSVARSDTHVITPSDVHTRLPSFRPEAWWRSNPETGPWSGSADLKVYFKFVQEPEAAPVAEWQREVWNQGFSPLLWLISPEKIELYNGFGRPQRAHHATRNRINHFRLLDSDLTKLEGLAGRLAMETGEFWRQVPHVNRKTTVDSRLLRDLGILERDLIDAKLDRDEAQALIGQSIFTQYLIDRKIVTKEQLMGMCGHAELPDIFSDREATARLFNWLREIFNGDMFPTNSRSVPGVKYLHRVAEFLNATDPDGQTSLFPYRFDVIPVELISAIYEQFVHSCAAEGGGNFQTNHPARREGVYYTPLAAVSLVLDEVFNGLTGDENVLDITCGSGVFLVEALRRLVYLKAGGGAPTRRTIRNALYKQLYGVDISPAAIRIAAFSLYLAALELDPNPQPPEALRFQPLVGKTLLVGDAHVIEQSPDGRTALATRAGPKKFDVIVGNPPWSFKGQAGTAARRVAALRAPLQPRGQSLDFVARAKDFAHDKTRFGMVLSATPFFSRSGTGVEAARSVVESLAPVTLVNLSELSGWLFPKANMPAVALLARHRDQGADRMTLVQARWSLAGERSHTIEISPSDITTLPVVSWKRNHGLFKAAFLGRRHDLLLLDELWEKYEPLEKRLHALSTSLKTGLILGDRSRDASALKGLPFLRHRLRPWLVPDDLPAFNENSAERPRHRKIYSGPLLLVGEYMQGRPRPVTAIANQDLVYSDAYFGASFAGGPSDAAYLVAGILGSALASWYFLMTASAFGLWIRRVKPADIVSMPFPDFADAIGSNAGKQVLKHAHSFHRKPPDEEALETLDNSVFDLYGLDDADRIVVRDGLFRASWQWKRGRLESTAPAELSHLKAYAYAFLSTMDAWLSVSNRRRMRAEIYSLTPHAPLRVIRFVLENTPGPSVVEVTTPDESLSAVLSRIGERTKVRITDALVGVRDLRVHAKDEVSIIKPSARRNWLGVRGLEDADAVMQDSVRGHRTT